MKKQSASKKRKHRIFFLTVSILAVVIAGAAFFGYQLLFNNLDEGTKAVIHEEVGEITMAIIDEIKAGNIAQNPGPVTVQDEPASSKDGTQPPEQNEKGSNEQPGAKEDEIARIIASYENGFERLKDEGNAILDRLITELKAEYKVMKTSGGGKIDLGKLAASYTSKAKAYESGIDSSVNALSAEMKEDLIAAGMDEKEAAEYIDRLKEEYKKQKEERRKLMLSKAKEYL